MSSNISRVIPRFPFKICLVENIGNISTISPKCQFFGLPFLLCFPRYDNHSANDPLFTAVKVALYVAEEDELELAKSFGKNQMFKQTGSGVFRGRDD